MHDLVKLHDEYGEVLRIGPNELTYINPSVWKEIYGYNSGRPELVKDPRTHDGMGTVPAIINANTEHHAYLRKLLSHGFSDKALREQEPVIQEFVDLLIRRLGEESSKGDKPLDMAIWFNVSPICSLDHIYLTNESTVLSISSDILVSHPLFLSLFNLKLTSPFSLRRELGLSIDCQSPPVDCNDFRFHQAQLLRPSVTPAPASSICRSEKMGNAKGAYSKSQSQ